MVLPEVPDWTQLIQLMGQYAGTPTLVAVDAVGNIVAVMKGEYAGTLKSIAVDAAGRVIMIPTDPADVWGNAISMGNAELVARLTGLGGYDRRGNAIFFDIFDAGLAKGSPVVYGTGAAVEISTASARYGGYSLKLTAGSDSSREAGFQYYLPYPIFSKVGFETSFTVGTNTTYFTIHLNLYDGSTYYSAGVRFDEDNSKVQYLSGAAGWQDLITGVTLYELSKAYHTLKMVIDLASGKYHRVFLDGWSWTAGDLSFYSEASVLGKRFLGHVRHYGAAGTNAVSYIDGVIITQNES